MRKLIPGLVALSILGLVGCGGGAGGVNKTSMKIYVQQRLYDKAIAQGTKALALNAADGDTHYFLGVAYYGKDNDQKPEAPAYGDSAELFLSKAYEHFEAAKKLAAGAWGKSADDNIVSMFGRHYNRGVIATKKNDHATAALEYRLATIADHENYQGYYAHAAAIWELAKLAKKAKNETEFDAMTDAALLDLERVIELKPADKDRVVSVWQTKGEILWQKGQKKESQEALARAIELDPENYDLPRVIGNRFYNDGDFEGAIEYLTLSLSVKERLNQVGADDAETYSIIGTIYNKQGKFDEALASFDKALKLTPEGQRAYEEALYNVLVTHYKAGDSFEKDGKMDEAKAHYNEGIKVGTQLVGINPNKDVAYQVLGYCQRGIGDTAAAARSLKRFNELRQKAQ